MSLKTHIRDGTKIGNFLKSIVILPTLDDLPSLKSPIVKHSDKRYSLIGRAFDNLIRMIISKKEKIPFEVKTARGVINKHHKKFRKKNCDSECCCSICKHKQLFDNLIIINDKAIEGNLLEEMCKNSLAFSRLEMTIWGGEWNENWASSFNDDKDVQELIKLYELWNKSFVFPNGKIQLNPTFRFGLLVSGADADLIVGNNLFDWKVVYKPRGNLRKMLAQQVGYILLSILQNEKVTTSSLYFARYGVTYTVPIEQLINIEVKEALNKFKQLTYFDEYLKDRRKWIKVYLPITRIEK